jgi:saccharopine dehydrogenase-like NADP-dependent oxidoreductase
VHLAVVGGGGAMGRIAVRALVEDARVDRVTVVDLRASAAERTVAWLARGRDKAHATACDVRDAEALAALLADAAVVLNAADYPYNLDVMRAALAARVSYADLGGLFHMSRRQYELDAAFRDAGRAAVLGIGSTPGITNVLARLAVDQLDRVERLDVRIGSGDARPADAGFVPPYSIRTILDECTLEPMVYRNGRWSAVQPMSGQEDILFPAPVGHVTAMYTLHSEVALFPVSFRAKGLRHASFKIAFPPAFLGQLQLLIDVGLAGTQPVAVRAPEAGGPTAVAPRELLAALLDARQRPATEREPDDCDVLRVIAQGTRDGQAVELVEEMVVRPHRPWRVGAGDIDTGVPLAIAGILLASGSHPPGAHGAEVVFEPEAFLRELAPYGMHATQTTVRTIS